MARGWESKSVEAQQEAAGERNSSGKRLSPEEAELARELTRLQLSLKTVTLQLEAASNPRHLEMLARARADLEEKIGRLQRGYGHQTG